VEVQPGKSIKYRKLLFLIKEEVGDLPTSSCCAPGMGDNLAVKVRCGLGSGNH